MDKILVIGDSCKDIFVYCEASRLCPDIPVPVLNIVNQTENEGMAKNVQRNILAMNPNCDIITNTNWETITKTRYMHLETNHMFIRIDSDHSLIKRIDIKSLDLSTLQDRYKTIAISDYDKGFLLEEDIQLICEHHNNVFIDSKKKIGNWANKSKIIKINNYEFNKSKDTMTSDLLDKTIHTKGSDGCFFKGIQYPVHKVEVKDSSGAGDSFFAGLVSNYHITDSIEIAIKFANKCASEVVQHRGVTIINQ